MESINEFFSCKSNQSGTHSGVKSLNENNEVNYSDSFESPQRKEKFIKNQVIKLNDNLDRIKYEEAKNLLDEASF